MSKDFEPTDKQQEILSEIRRLESLRGDSMSSLFEERSNDAYSGVIFDEQELQKLMNEAREFEIPYREVFKSILLGSPEEIRQYLLVIEHSESDRLTDEDFNNIAKSLGLNF